MSEVRANYPNLFLVSSHIRLICSKKDICVTARLNILAGTVLAGRTFWPNIYINQIVRISIQFLYSYFLKFNLMSGPCFTMNVCWIALIWSFQG